MHGARAGRLPTRPGRRVLLQLGRCMATQDFTAAHDAFTKSEALFQACNDQWGATTALSKLGYLLINLRPSYAEAWRCLVQSVAGYRALSDEIGLSKALIDLSLAARYIRHIPESLALAREAYALAQASANPRMIAQAASNLGAALFWDNTYPEAYETLRSALEIAQELGDQAELSNYYYRLGNATAYLGRYAEARASYTSGLAVAQRVDDALETCEIQVALAWVALAEGNAREAFRLAEEAFALSVRLGESQLRWQALTISALAARRLGTSMRARVDTMAALRFGLSTQTTVLWGLCTAALLLADSGKPERAAEVVAFALQTHVMDNRLTQDFILRELRAILAALPPDVAAAARARGEGRDYWEAVAELLGELEAEGWESER